MSDADDLQKKQDSSCDKNLDINNSPLTLEERRKNFGILLKSTRENAGQTHRDIIHLTRISPPFLQALEDGNFDILPGEVFGRGFLKNICKVLEVDHSLIISAYNKCWDKNQPSTRQYSYKENLGFKKTKSTYKHNRKRLPFSNYFSMKGVLFWACISMCIITIISIIVYKSSFFNKLPVSEVAGSLTPDTSNETQGNNLKETLAKDHQALEDKPTEAQNLQKALPVKKALKKDLGSVKIIAPKSLSLLSSKEKVSKLAVQVMNKIEIKHRFDNEHFESHVYEPGSYEFKFLNRLDFYCQDMSNIDIKFNGRSLGEFGNNRDAKQLTFMSKNDKFVKF